MFNLFLSDWLRLRNNGTRGEPHGLEPGQLGVHDPDRQPRQHRRRAGVRPAREQRARAHARARAAARARRARQGRACGHCGQEDQYRLVYRLVSDGTTTWA